MTMLMVWCVCQMAVTDRITATLTNLTTILYGGYKIFVISPKATMLVLVTVPLLALSSIVAQVRRWCSEESVFGWQSRPWFWLSLLSLFFALPLSLHRYVVCVVNSQYLDGNRDDCVSSRHCPSSCPIFHRRKGLPCVEQASKASILVLVRVKNSCHNLLVCSRILIFVRANLERFLQTDAYMLHVASRFLCVGRVIAKKDAYRRNSSFLSWGEFSAVCSVDDNLLIMSHETMTSSTSSWQGASRAKAEASFQAQVPAESKMFFCFCDANTYFKYKCASDASDILLLSWNRDATPELCLDQYL